MTTRQSDLSAELACKAERRSLALDAMATDPPVSEAQRRAMEAAAHGHSTLGIPKKVGEEFVGKDAKVTIELQHPKSGERKKVVAPSGLTTEQARRWASENNSGWNAIADYTE